MKKMVLRILAGAMFYFAAACCAQMLGEYESRVTEHTLDNGMHFIFLRDGTAPVISFHVQVNTGSVDEKYGETGISHIIEHLAFNGTRTIGTENWEEERTILARLDAVYDEILRLRAENSSAESLEILQEEFIRLNAKANSYARPNEFGRILDMQGAVGPNAYCSYDMTVYWVELPSNKTELWALLESDRLFNPVFRGFYEEMEVIKEERRMRVDNSPWGRLMEEFHGIAWKVHPYRNPVIGYPADLESVTRRQVREFYERHYAPANMVVVIAGDVEPAELIPMLEKYFGAIPAAKHPETFIPAEPPLENAEKRVAIHLDSEPIFLTGFHIPDANHPDIPALEVCAEILAGGRTSRLHRRLVTGERSALSTGAWARAPKYPGMFYIWAVASAEGTNEELERAVMDELYRIIKEDTAITQRELEGARARLAMGFLTGLSSRRGMARQMAWAHSITGDWRNLFTYMEKIERVTAEDIAAVMEKYFTNANRFTGTVERKR